MNELYLFGKKTRRHRRLYSAAAAVAYRFRRHPMSQAFCRYSGLMHILEMARLRKINHPNYRKPPTLLLWVVGLYIALYGVAATRYEAALDRVENRMDAIVTQTTTDDDLAFKKLIAQIPRIQRMETPPEPDLLWPFRGNFSMTSLLYLEPNPGILQWTKEIVETWRNKLAGVNFNGINLAGALLWEADLAGAKLGGANLTQTILLGADLSGTVFREANLSGAVLGRADLSNAFFLRANLSGAWLRDIKNWQEIRHINGANIFDVKKAPEGFRAWARERGAVEMAPAAWAEYLENFRKKTKIRRGWWPSSSEK